MKSLTGFGFEILTGGRMLWNFLFYSFAIFLFRGLSLKKLVRARSPDRLPPRHHGRGRVLQKKKKKKKLVNVWLYLLWKNKNRWDWSLSCSPSLDPLLSSAVNRFFCLFSWFSSVCVFICVFIEWAAQC